jgi:hypothetical protein
MRNLMFFVRLNSLQFIRIIFIVTIVALLAALSLNL